MRRTALALVLASGCGASGASQPIGSTAPAVVDAHHGPMGEIVGITSREEIEGELPAWREAREQAHVDPEAVQRLSGVAPGAEVVVFLGTWCGDSRREVSRLFAALDQADALPFSIQYIGVDRGKRAAGFTEHVNLLYVPTIIVRRDGSESGRIIESAPLGVERALLELLNGARTGIISGRLDVGATP